MNEFTIIFFFFFEKIGKKKNAQKISFLVSTSFFSSFLLFWLAPPSSFLLFQFFSSFLLFWSAPPSFLLSSRFFFFWFCFQHLPLFFLFFPPFFFPFSHYVLPFFSPRVEPKTCCPSSAQHVLILKPKSLSLFVRAFPFQFRPLSTPKGTCFSCQLPRPKIFSLDASHFFYFIFFLFQDKQSSKFGGV